MEDADDISTKAPVEPRGPAFSAQVSSPRTAVKGADVGIGEAKPPHAEGSKAAAAGDREVKTRSAGTVAIPVARKRPTGPKKARAIPKPEACGDVQLGFLSDFLGFHLRLAQDASYRTFAKHRDKDLIKPGRYPAMAIIHLNPGISQSALGRAIARDKSTVSPLIKDLQKNGFISRKASTQDRRSVTLSLTKKGERVLDRLHVRATEHERELDRLVGGSKGRLMMLLDKIIAGMAA